MRVSTIPTGATWATGLLRPSLLGLLVLVACAMPSRPNYRALHELDGEVVYSRPASSLAYEEYMRARMAMTRDPAQSDVALAHINRALRLDPGEPQLWTTRAEIDHMRGDDLQALTAARRALSLREGYPPAVALIEAMQRGDSPTRHADTNVGELVGNQ